MTRRAARALSLATLTLLALLSLGACNSAPKEPEPTWTSSQLVVGSDNQLWQVVLLALNATGFPQGAEMNRGDMHVVSGWKIELSPWKGRGTRKQAEVLCTPLGPGRWSVDVRVKMQTNQTLAQTLDYSYADWEWVDDDETTARIIVQHMRAYLRPELILEDAPADPVEEYLRRVGDD